VFVRVFGVRGAGASQCARTMPSATMAIPASVKIGAGVVLPTSVALFAGIKKLNARAEAKAAEKGRAALAGMSGLADLADLSLEREGASCREVGDWKEYTKADGRKWYYHIPSGKMQWAVPDEMKEAWTPTTFE